MTGLLFDDLPAAPVAPAQDAGPRILPHGWGWMVAFPCGTQLTADDGGPLRYRQCDEAIERWERERQEIDAKGS